MHRAYSMLDVKSVETDKRMFRGIATTPTLDRVSDSINPLGAKFAAEIPLLHAHKHDAPIGIVRLGKPTKDGIPFEAEIPVIHEPPTLKERVDVAFGEIAHGLVRAVSIGFRATAMPELNKSGGLDFPEIEIMELSTVSVPANSQAIISAVKSLDQQAREAAGVEDDPLPEIPSAPEPQPEGKKAVVVRLGEAAQDRAPPFVIKKIHPARKRA